MSTKNWRAQLKEARDLKKKGIGLLFQRVEQLVSVHDDPEFRQWCADGDKDVYDELDREVDDTATDFITLRAVYDAFPNADDWTKRGLPELIAECMKKQKAERKPREVQGWKERALSAEKRVLALEAENERLRGEVKQLTARVAELHESVEFARKAMDRMELAGAN